MFKTKLERLEEENKDLLNLIKKCVPLLQTTSYDCRQSTPKKKKCASIFCTTCTSQAELYAEASLDLKSEIYRKYGSSSIPIQEN